MRPPLSSFDKRPPLESFHAPTPKISPVEITQTFGEQSPYEPQTGGVNYGVDYKTPPGTDVTLPKGNWQVQEAYNKADPMGGNLNNWDNQGYGNSVVVKNNDTGETLRFSHLSQVKVEPGQNFEGGSIGATGSSGHVTGPHLDFEMRDPQGNPTDPLQSPYGNVVPHVDPNATPTPNPVEQPVPQTVPTPKDSPVKPPLQDFLGSIVNDTKPADDGTFDPAIETQIGSLPPEHQQNMRLVARALKDEGVLTPQTMAYALATVNRETAGSFAPVREGFFADDPNNPGATGQSEAVKRGYDGGAPYYGRGFIQLTGKGNYDSIGKRIGVPDLGDNPDKALDPQVSAKAMAAFFKDRGVADRANQGDFVGARGPINGSDQAQEIADNANKYLSTPIDTFAQPKIPPSLLKKPFKSPAPLSYYHDLLK